MCAQARIHLPFTNLLMATGCSPCNERYRLATVTSVVFDDAATGRSLQANLLRALQSHECRKGQYLHLCTHDLLTLMQLQGHCCQGRWVLLACVATVHALALHKHTNNVRRLHANNMLLSQRESAIIYTMKQSGSRSLFRHQTVALCDIVQRQQCIIRSAPWNRELADKDTYHTSPLPGTLMKR